MPHHLAIVNWTRDGSDFAANRYSRAHEWRFDGGAVVPASASPDIVPLPYSDPAAVDPEEAFVAALASCHMLFFLSFSQQAGLEIEAYSDRAKGYLTKSEEGAFWVSRVELNPQVTWLSPEPEQTVLHDLHHRAHAACFIANSVRTEVVTNL